MTSLRSILAGKCDRKYISEEKRKREGVFVDEKTWNDIKKLSQKLNIKI